MNLHYNVQEQTVMTQGQLRFVGVLTYPDIWATAYHWSDSDNNSGVVEGAGGQRRYFNDIAEIQFAIDAWTTGSPVIQQPQISTPLPPEEVVKEEAAPPLEDGASQ